MSQNDHLRPGPVAGYDRYAQQPVPNVFRNLYDEILSEPVPQGLIDTVQSALERLNDDTLVRLCQRDEDTRPPPQTGEGASGIDNASARPHEASP